MRLWLNRKGDVSLRDQLMTQVVLGILGRELLPGSRLPSTRELARRFGIHANTASAAYTQLEREGWVEQRHGSGVFVRRSRPDAALTPEMAVDQLIGQLAAKARKLGASESLVRDRLQRWLAMEPPARWLLIEPDPALAAIVLHEIEPALTLPIADCRPEQCRDTVASGNAMPLVLPSKAAAVRQLLPPERDLTVLQVQPVSNELQQKLQRYLPEHATDLIGIASHWTDFQRIAQTMLIAVGLRPESLLVCDANSAGWKRGLETTSGVVCDSVTAEELPPGCFPMVFRLIAESSIAEMRATEFRITGDGAASAPQM
jgi:DNA-binding transcriptional regulator YhcF (GntR family)